MFVWLVVGECLCAISSSFRRRVVYLCRVCQSWVSGGAAPCHLVPFHFSRINKEQDVSVDPMRDFFLIFHEYRLEGIFLVLIFHEYRLEQEQNNRRVNLTTSSVVIIKLEPYNRMALSWLLN